MPDKPPHEAYDEAEQTDSHLFMRLQGGDNAAYVTLWTRHVSAALRYAKQVAPAHHEDLVAESFMAVFQQAKNGDREPISSFRAYLFTVMRNTAIRWNRASSMVEPVAVVEQPETADAHTLLEDAAGAELLLAAFKELPPRWQRALWLSDVENISRTEISRELGIRPNAVSALLRRARNGLRTSWVLLQIPSELREDHEHVAHMFPDYVTRSRDPAHARQIETHIAVCNECADLLSSLQETAAQLDRVRLSVSGFGALQIVLPAAVPLGVLGSVAAGTTIAIGTGALLPFGTLSLGGLAVLTVCGVLLASAVTSTNLLGTDESDANSYTLGGPTTSAGANNADGEPRGNVTDETDVRTQTPAGGAELQASGVNPAGTTEWLSDTGEIISGAPQPSPAVPPDQAVDTPTGRWVNDPTIPAMNFGNPTAGGTPGPPTPPPAERVYEPPAPAGPPDTAPSITMTSAATSADYIPALIEGQATPDAQVRISYRNNTYSAPVDDEGVWSFDPAFLIGIPGDYTFTIWAERDGESSEQLHSVFTAYAPGVTGFTGNDDLMIDEATTSGIVITVTGPENALICVDTTGDGYAEFALDDRGFATKRLLMHTGGFYMFYFEVCADGRQGAYTDAFVWIDDPEVIFGPFLPEEDLSFSIVDVE